MAMANRIDSVGCRPWLKCAAVCLAAAAVSAGCKAPRRPLPQSDMDAAEARRRAVEQVLASSRSDDPRLRARAIEAAHGLDDHVVQLTRLGLADTNDGVRFGAVVTAGRFRMKQLAPTLGHLRGDPSPSVRAAALFALQRCGEPVDLSPLATMLKHADPTLRANAALLLGRLGQSSALPMLKDIARLGQAPTMSPREHARVKIQIAEAMVLLGDDGGRDPIRAAAFSQHEHQREVRVMAVRMLGELGDRAYSGALLPLLSRDPVELRVAAAEALARLGDQRWLDPVLDACRLDVPIRAQAALALGRFDDPRARRVRGGMLDDEVEVVRLAAAAAIVEAAGRK